MKFNMTFVFAIVTAATAIIGIFMSWWQIRNSNKQSLFEKRLQIFLFADSLASLIRETPAVLNEKDDIEMANDFDLWLLTNNAELSGITPLIKDAKDAAKHQAFLKELESFKGREQTAKFVFKGPTAYIVSNFICSYRELLFSTYQYQILIDNMTDAAKEHSLSKEEAAQVLHENTYRAALNKRIKVLQQNLHVYGSDYAQSRLRGQINLASI
ncbi:hypothetical protein NRF22_05510 [Oenococcus kitaharae]|uniref:hypothetical protein n=1 Tax=Oenococcus TaxID=46254 RepID=UPI0021E93487|nr:hypothetical protein [Oenococcus kitaharae]MCV3296570.1 hypothetical protein [Oenococcus kitaharae]